MRDESGAITAIQWENLSPENKHLARWEHLPIGPGHPLSDQPAPPGAAEPAAAPLDTVAAGSGALAPTAVSDDESSGSEGEGAGGGGGGGGGSPAAAAAAAGGGAGARPSPGSPEWGPEDMDAVRTGHVSKSLCMVKGCATKLVTKKVSVVANTLLFGILRPFKKRSNRHTCRSCKIKVCSTHFTKAPGGMKICTECLALGVDGPKSSN